MLEICRRKGAERGLTPQLFEQPMHALELPRRYRTVVVCGAFGLGTTQEEDAEALGRIFEHLLPGGTLALDFETPWTDPEQWRAWTPERRRELPLPFESGSDTLEDGSAYRWSSRLESVDPYDRLVVRRVRYEVLADGKWSTSRSAISESGGTSRRSSASCWSAPGSSTYGSRPDTNTGRRRPTTASPSCSRSVRAEDQKSRRPSNCAPT
jgi:hypothetical protein